MSEPGRCPRLLVLSSPHPPAGPMPDPSSGLLCSPAAASHTGLCGRPTAVPWARQGGKRGVDTSLRRKLWQGGGAG